MAATPQNSRLHALRTGELEGASPLRRKSMLNISSLSPSINIAVSIELEC